MSVNNTDVVYAPAAQAPVKAMWICMILAWVFFVLPIPFSVFLAGPLNLAAFILAILCIVRSRVGQGVIGLIGTTIGSGLLYALFYIVLFAAAATSAAASATPGAL